MFKTTMNYDEKYVKLYEDIINSYSASKKDTLRTTAIYYSNKVMRKIFHKNEFFKAYQTEKLDLKPIANPNWDEKTKELYQKFLSSNKITWGIFTVNDVEKAMSEKVPDIEEKLDYKFDIILVYNHLGNPLQVEEMKKIHEENRIIELTVQTCVNNNTRLFGYTPIFDILDGKKDKQIRTLAKEIKEFGNPVLFRLNNEMNTDWTSYSGIIALSDSTIYKDVWKYIYNIFEEENVANCIWIYNPNDNNYPPSIWNNFLCYYPGNEYVQMLGITGYNTGTYYEKQNAERFREFKEIYDDINGKYKDIFSKFPWIITQFASSSIGGDKAKWIENMFKNIENYPNIKAAVWFSNADYDPAYENNTKVSRPYWLDETDETIEAFKKGIHKD